MISNVREISGRELVADIRSGFDDFELMRKYQLTKKQLKALVKRLEEVGAVKPLERMTLDLSLKEFLADIGSGSDASWLMDRYLFSEQELKGVCDRLAEMGRLDLDAFERLNAPAAAPEPPPVAPVAPAEPVEEPLSPADIVAALPRFENKALLALRKDAEALERLLNAGMDPNSVDRHFRRPALIWAAGYGNLDAVRTLLREGARVDLADRYGRTAAEWAENKGHTDIAVLLAGR